MVYEHLTINYELPKVRTHWSCPLQASRSVNGTEHKISSFRRKKDHHSTLYWKGICNSYPAMPTIIFSTEGIEKLLSNLNPRKACGPDLIPIRILKKAAKEIAPILQVIFTHYETGDLPDDWLSAQLHCLKKGIKACLQTTDLCLWHDMLCHHKTDGAL